MTHRAASVACSTTTSSRTSAAMMKSTSTPSTTSTPKPADSDAVIDPVASQGRSRHGHHNRRNTLKARHAQRGVAAIEFAFVFPLFFVVLYAIIAYCLILCANMALAGAAQEGARAALANPAGATTPTDQYTQRMANACSTANALTTWLTGTSSTTSCGQSAGDCTAGSAACTTVSQAPCGPSNAMVCITVAMSYDYADHPIVPKLPLLGFVTPAQLGASSTVQLDPASIISNM